MVKTFKLKNHVKLIFKIIVYNLIYIVNFDRKLSLDQLKEFLQEIKKNKILYEEVSKVGTADEIALIARNFGYAFTGNELKSIDNKELKGIKIKKQDTSPSYPFGESGN